VTPLGWTVLHPDGRRVLRVGWRWSWHYGDREQAWTDGSDGEQPTCYEVEDNARRAAADTGGTVIVVGVPGGGEGPPS